MNQPSDPDNPTSDPPSPCNSICIIDPETGYCEGCYRDLHEIAEWPMLSAEDKHRVIAELAGRRKFIKNDERNEGGQNEPE